jgi:uncharacterized membrane protein (DUF373 family)/uncharacterized protein (DUF2267 family)
VQYAESLLFLALAVLLLAIAVLVVVPTATRLMTPPAQQAFAETVTQALNGVLFVVIVVVLLRTSVARLEGQGLRLQPFPVIAIVSTVRHILTVARIGDAPALDPAGGAVTRCWTRVTEPVDEKTSRATLESIAGQIAGGELDRLALPDSLGPHLPRHHEASRPKPLHDVVREISSRTHLKEDEVQRGIGAVLSVLHESTDPTHLDHALSLLPAEYRRLATG